MSPCEIGIAQMVQSLPAPLPAYTLPSTGNSAPVARRVRIVRRRSSSEPPEISNAGLRKRRLQAMSEREPARSLRFSRQRVFDSDIKVVISLAPVTEVSPVTMTSTRQQTGSRSEGEGSIRPCGKEGKNEPS